MVLVLVLAVTGWSWWQARGSGACGGDGALVVASAPEMSAVVEDVLADVDVGDVTGDAGCSVSVEAAAPRAVVSGLGGERSQDAPAGGHPDLWVPDTSAWLSQLPSGLAGRPTWSLAKTPVVLAGHAGGPAPQTWLAAMQSGQAQMLDPRSSGAGMGTLAALHAEAVRGDTTGTDLSGWLVGAAQSAKGRPVDDAGVLDAVAAGRGGYAQWVPSTEQRYLQHEQGGAGRLTAQVPRSGTTLLDYPVVATTQGDSAGAASSVAAALAGRMSSESGTRRLAEAGFRPVSGVPIDVPRALGPVTELGVVQPDAVQGLVRTWVTLGSDAQLLAVLDVSGSMNEYEGSRTRVALARDAALTALRTLPDGWSMGLWAFSQHLDGRSDHRELADVGALGAADGGATHRERLQRAVRRLPSLVNGGTGLYDTALAGFRTAKREYRPGTFNSVVLLTDGRNEDPDGIGLRRLLSRLRPQGGRAVRIITIGMGPEADTAALRRIADATGGSSYVARDPQDIGEIFNQALLDRVGWGLR